MTKPAVLSVVETAGVLSDSFIINGVQTYENHRVVVRSTTVNQKPESLTSPFRVDGTRAPTNWGRYGGTMYGVRGRYTIITNVRPDTYTSLWHGQIAAPGLYPGNIPYLDSEGEITAIRKALGRFGEAEVQLGAAMREARQTAGMLEKYYNHANTLTKKLMSAVQGSKAVRQQFRDFLRNGWKDVPAAYLEYLFGMKPLADDLTNAVQVLHDKKQHGGAFNMTLRGKHKVTDRFKEPSYQSWVPYVSQVYGTHNVRQISKATLIFQLPTWYWDRLPPVTFFRESWETTRLSFVLDWVLPVNQWLMGFEGNQLRPFFREGTRSTFMRRDLSDPEVDDPNWVFESDGWGQDYSYSRVAFDSFPTEELLTRLPRFRSLLGLDKLSVGAALLGQRLASLAGAVAGRPIRLR